MYLSICQLSWSAGAPGMELQQSGCKDLIFVDLMPNSMWRFGLFVSPWMEAMCSESW